MLEFTSMRCLLFVCLAACSTGTPVMPDSSVDMDSGIDDADAREVKVYPDAPPHVESGILVIGPDLLSQTGLYSDIGSRTLAPRVTAFTPRWPLWSDAAEKKRWILLPPGQRIDTTNMDQWEFPVGTKLWKEFKVSTTVVETRLLWKVSTGGWPYWWMGAYRWRVDGTDADYQKQGEPNALGTTHDVPSQVDCVRCHNGLADVGIGFSAMQLSAPQNSQLATFAAMGWFTKAPSEYEPPGQGTEKDTLTTLHTNCGHCHNEYSLLYTKQTMLVLRLRVTDATPQETGAYAAVGLKVKHWGTGIWGDYAFVAGRPDLSQGWLRMNVRDNGIWQMPPVCTKAIDTTGVTLVGNWITSLPPGPDM